MDRFPDLFKWAWRKNKTVKEELHNQNWTRGLWRMQTVEEMASFVQLWDLVQSVQLSDQQDQITWRWTSDGIYTTKSAYNAQFLGSFSTSERRTFGEQMLKASTSSLLGFSSNVSF